LQPVKSDFDSTPSKLRKPRAVRAQNPLAKTFGTAFRTSRVVGEGRLPPRKPPFGSTPYDRRSPTIPNERHKRFGARKSSVPTRLPGRCRAGCALRGARWVRAQWRSLSSRRSRSRRRDSEVLELELALELRLSLLLLQWSLLLLQWSLLLLQWSLLLL
jgi:hypothetical protein